MSSVIDWCRFIGFVSNACPSGIFRLPRLSSLAQNIVDPTTGLAVPVPAQLGISIEPLVDIDSLAKGKESESKAVGVNDYYEFAVKLLQSFFHYAQSWVKTVPGTAPDGRQSVEAVVPAGVLNAWFETFQRKLERDPEFWRNVTR